MELFCDSPVRLVLVGDPLRVTVGKCPDHGPYQVIERYDCERGRWEVALQIMPVQEPSTPRTVRPPRPSVRVPTTPESTAKTHEN
mgnify:CR=1 FL=1